MSSTSRLLKNNFYALKRQYGTDLEVFTELETTFDPKTGRKDITKARLYVRRALVWEFRGDLSFTYSIQYIRANSNFAQGGFYEQDDRLVAIDTRDINTFKIDRNSTIVYQQNRYSIVTKKLLENEGAMLLQVRQISGDKPNRQIALNLSDKTKTEQGLAPL